jgi:hypothetical protein
LFTTGLLLAPPPSSFCLLTAGVLTPFMYSSSSMRSGDIGRTGIGCAICGGFFFNASSVSMTGLETSIEATVETALMSCLGEGDRLNDRFNFSNVGDVLLGG